MNPQYEHLIPKIIDLHKKSTGNILDWSSLRSSLPELPKSEKDGMRLALIKTGAIEPASPGNPGYTRLIDYYFDYNEYKAKMVREEEKADIDFKLVKQQLADYPKVKKQASDAIKIAIVSAIAAVLSAIIAAIALIF